MWWPATEFDEGIRVVRGVAILPSVPAAIPDDARVKALRVGADDVDVFRVWSSATLTGWRQVFPSAIQLRASTSF